MKAVVEPFVVTPARQQEDSGAIGVTIGDPLQGDRQQVLVGRGGGNVHQQDLVRFRPRYRGLGEKSGKHERQDRRVETPCHVCTFLDRGHRPAAGMIA